MVHAEPRRRGGLVAVHDSAEALPQCGSAKILPGTYSISAVRLLSASESMRLAPGQSDVDAFGGAGTVDVRVPSTTLVVRAFAGRRGTVVISEIWSGEPAVGNSFYDDGDFMELYNNGDVSVALADKVIISGYPERTDNPTFGCEQDATLQQDSMGIWTPFIYAFPPAAQPLAPGATRLLATDAIDHTQVTTA